MNTMRVERSLDALDLQALSPNRLCGPTSGRPLNTTPPRANADAACVSGPSMLSSSTCTLAHE